MKPPIKTVILACLAVGGALGAEPGKPIQDLILDDHTVYSVPVAANRVTTINFPSPISAIDAALVTTDAKNAGLFQIAHTKGTSYFSARALAKDAATNLNVRWNDRTYVIELREDSAPWLSVIFQPRDDKANRPHPLSPPRLLGLLDKAKAFPLLKDYHPDAVADVDYRDGAKQPCVTDCGDYQVRVNEAFRFNLADTLVFHLTLQNKTLAPISFAPERMQLKVGHQTCVPSVTQLSGMIPANGVAEGYVAFTGTPGGERNDFSLKNDFTFLLERTTENSGGLPLFPNKGEEGFQK